jgi:uncharacterized protein (DUF433 family)
MSPLITKKRTIQGGTPVITGTRVPVSVLISYTFYKNGLQKARNEYPQLTEKQILAAWEFTADKLGRKLHGSAAKV